MIGELDFAWMEEVERSVRPALEEIDRLIDRNQLKVLSAFAGAKVGDAHLFGSTGYGLGDRGREQLDAVFAAAFGAQAGLVRPSLASGTHALAAAYFGLLRPGDTLLYATGAPYDTLETVIGLRGAGMGSLREFGIEYRCVELASDGGVDVDAVLAALDGRVRVVAFQRSAGYRWRRALRIAELGRAIAAVKAARPDVWTVVDNCYGEFTDTAEPSAVGADLTVGSLIKNPGGGLAPTGGYMVGAADAVERASYRVTAPGVGAEMGSHEQYRLYFQGLFMAPHTVGQALKGNVFAAAAFTRAGIDCAPGPDEERADSVLRIRLGTAERLVAFCQAIQQASPIDAHVAPEPGQMPGYGDPVVMAAGAFVQGSTSELSADGPLRDPYIAYLQGGLTYSHVKIAVTRALKRLGLLP